MAKGRLLKTVMDEIFMTLSVFTRKETFLGYVKLSITRDLFKNENEYNQFYELLSHYHDVMMKAEQTYTVTLIQELEDALNALADRFPEQTDRLILETVYDARETKRVPDTLSYITKRNVISTKFTSVTAGEQSDKVIYTMGMLSSSTIHKYLDDGKLSKSEQYFCDTFFDTEKGRKILQNLSPSDIARCVQDTRMMPAVYFSINNIFENTEKGEERLALTIQYLYGDIRNFNLDRFKLILYYRSFKEMYKANEFTTENIEFLESLRQECAAAIPSAPLALNEVSFTIPDLSDKEAFEINLISAPTGRILPMNSVSRKPIEPEVEPTPSKNVLSLNNELADFSKIELSGFGGTSKSLSGAHAVESMVQDFPTFAVTTDNGYITREVVLPEEEIISKRMLLKEMEDLLLALKFDQIIKIYEDEIQKRHGNDSISEIDRQKERKYRYASIKECLKGITLNKENLNIFANRILEKVKFENLECNSEEIEEIFKTEKRAIINYLFNEKIFSLAIAIEFDFEAVCMSIKNNEMNISAEDFSKTRLLQHQREIFINMAIQNETLLQALLNSNNITKNDILLLNFDSYVELVPLLYNRNILNNVDLMLLMKQGKITLNDIDNFDLENVSISDSEIISKYSEIYQKKLEYEAAAKANYDKALLEGIDEEDIKESDEEIRLREELQNLTYTKDVYITLFKKQKMTQLEEYHRRQDIYMEVIELCYADDDFEKSIADITNMLYADSFISMAQVQQFDDSLFIPILKSGMAKRDDIEKFKSEIVSVEEIEKIRSELSEIVEGEELEEEIRKQVYVLTYNKLSSLMERIISDPNSTKEEKLSILYSIFYKNNITEKTHREFFETEILVKIYGKLRSRSKLPVIDPNDEILQEEQIEPEDEKNDTVLPGNKHSSRMFVYTTSAIWDAIEILDNNFKFKILADGYVIFESEKLNIAFIENVWQANKDGDFVRRGYGTSTLILDLDIYKMHQSEIVKPGRHGYKLDVLKAKSYLPRVQTPKGHTTLGIFRHEKNLRNGINKPTWFENILVYLGITQVNVQNRTTVYTQEDFDKIYNFTMNLRTQFEEITK